MGPKESKFEEIEDVVFYRKNEDGTYDPFLVFVNTASIEPTVKEFNDSTRIF